MNTASAYAQGLAPSGGAPELKQRLSKALLDVSGSLVGAKAGALVQVWMPELCADGTIVLSCQGLPFAVAGVGDLLALFRCVSVRYRFSTDVMKPSLMGAIGRVYSSLEPEMSHNVQKYDKQVYLRVSEAQRCRVHSTMMVPVFGSESRDTPLAVFELVQGDREVTFPAVMSNLAQALQGVHLFTSDLQTAAAAAGLRKWPMQIDMRDDASHDAGIRLSPSDDAPRRINSATRLEDMMEGQEPAAPNIVIAEERVGSPTTSKANDEAAGWAQRHLSAASEQRPVAAVEASNRVASGSGAGPQHVPSSSPPSSSGAPGTGSVAQVVGQAGPPAAAAAPAGTAAATAGSAFSSSSSANTLNMGLTNPQQLMAWLAMQGGNAGALNALKEMIERQQGAAGQTLPLPSQQQQQVKQEPQGQQAQPVTQPPGTAHMVDASMLPSGPAAFSAQPVPIGGGDKRTSAGNLAAAGSAAALPGSASDQMTRAVGVKAAATTASRAALASGYDTRTCSRSSGLA